MRYWLVVLAFLPVLLLSSCSRGVLFDFWNNSGATVRIDDSRIDHGVAMRVASGVVSYPEGDMVVATTECRRSFPVGEAMRRYPWWRGSQDILPMQLEPDFSLYLLPHDVRLPALAADLEISRRAGLVLRPRSSSCNAR